MSSSGSGASSARQSPKPVSAEILFRRQMARQKGAQRAKLKCNFEARGDGRYVMTIPDFEIEIEVDRLRRDRDELIGELAVSCGLPGAMTIPESGTLSIVDLNLSSANTRTARADLLAKRANTGDTIDWEVLIEDFCQRVIKSERTGLSAVDLRDVVLTGREDEETFDILGISVPRDHPAILFGDGGTYKSYIDLYIAGKLAENGTRVAFFDWELNEEVHRRRLGRLFPDGMPQVTYAFCKDPLVHEVDRLRRIVRDKHIEYAIFDSASFGCDGPPEAAEVAGRYLRAIRQIGVGSLINAHVSKAKTKDGDNKPFGSVFWHNGARSIWFIKEAESSTEDIKIVGMFNTKANLGRKCFSAGLEVDFGPTKQSSITIRKIDVAPSSDLARHMSVHERMLNALKGGALTLQQLADEIHAEADAVRQARSRDAKRPGGSRS